jgi:hypothetical protein
MPDIVQARHHNKEEAVSMFMEILAKKLKNKDAKSLALNNFKLKRTVYLVLVGHQLI